MAKTVLITGASSGIGAELAKVYATEGANLLLTGRNQTRLEEVKQACEALGAKVEAKTLCVSKFAKMKDLIEAWDNKYKIDIAIANAGLGKGLNINQISDYGGFQETIDVNANGVFNTINPLVPKMIARKRGKIVLISSMAGFRGLPSAPAYSVSKVAVAAYGDALRPLLKKHGITVTTVFPGFIKTPLTQQNNFKMPFLMEVTDAAKLIKRGIDKNKATIAFPRAMLFLTKLITTYLPRALSDFILAHVPEK